jgi:Telomere resolvase
MGKRRWLNDLIENEYLPAISQLRDSEEGRTKAQQLAVTIREGWAAKGAKELKQQQSLLDQTRVAIKNRFGKNHFSLDFIKFSKAEYTELNDLKQGKVAKRNTQCVILDPGRINALIMRSVNLLQSQEWGDVAAALTVLTGRRSTEVMATAEFTPKTAYSVFFAGALKRRGEEQTLIFEIPTLCQAEYVLKGLERLRGLVDVENKTREAINAEYGQKVADACDRHFADLIPTRPGKDNLYSHLFRAIYGTIAVWFYCPVNVDATEFKAHCQGHFAVLDEKNPDLRRQLASSRHYSDFKIGDGKGNIDGRQGIHLDWQRVEVLEVFKEAADVPQPTITDRKHRSSLRIWKEDHDQVTAILTYFPGKNQQEKVSAWIDWTHKQLISTPATTEPAETTPSEPITEPQQPQKINTSKPIQSIEPVTNLLEQSVSSGLEEKLDKLIDVMAQFMQFQMQDQTNTQTTPASSASTQTKASPTPKPTPTPQPVQTIPNKMTGNIKVVAESKPRKYKTGEAEAIANQAIDAIMAHNDQPDQPYDLKWEITINGLKTYTTNQRVIERIVVERRAEIDAHHQHHQIGTGHNNRHKRKRKIGDVIQL